MRLSPLNLSGLIARERGALPRPGVRKRKGSATAVTVWKCDHCGDTHDEEDDAIACCEDEDVEPKTRGNSSCPCCLAPAVDLRDATDCCLWKDLDAPTRYRIADAVAAGSTWADQLCPNEH